MSRTYGKAQSGDFDRINGLFVEMLQTVCHTDRVSGYSPGDMDRFFAGGEDWICTAVDQDTIIGFLSIEVHREDRNYLYLDDLSVTEKYRSQGIGTALIRQAEEYAKELKLREICLHVEKTNVSARRLYQRLGYGIANEEETRYLMIKTL